MVDGMANSTDSDPRRSWRLGSMLLMANVPIGALLNFTDPPRWLQIIGVITIVAFVGVGSRLLFWGRGGGWRPSETLGGPRDDAG